MTKFQFYTLILLSKLRGKIWWVLWFKGRRVLDIGCGRGEMVEALGQSAIGIDINPEAVIEAAGKSARIIKGSAIALPFANQVFDAVITFNLIEHLDPLSAYRMLSEASRVLKNGGYLLLRTELNTPKFWHTFSHLRPYPPESIHKITNWESEETFPKLTLLKPIHTLYEGDYHSQPLLFLLNNFMAQILPWFRRSYLLILYKSAYD